MRRTSVSRVVHASRERIFSALLDAQSVAAWLPPKTMKARIEHFDARKGGEFRLTLTYVDAHPIAGKTTHEEDVVVGRFTEIVPNERMVWTTRFDSDDDAFAGEMTVAFQLSDARDGTLVTCTCENIPPGVRLEDNETGTAQSLEHLAALVEAKK